MSRKVPEQAEAIIDPLNIFGAQGILPSRLMDACGMLLQWALQQSHKTIKQAIQDEYKFGTWEDLPTSKFYLNPIDGVMIYPGDPTLFPLAVVMKPPAQRLYIYQHSWVVVTEDGVHWSYMRAD